jgi:hypothetical protein
MTVEPSYRIVEDDPEFGQYRDLTENKHQPLPDGVMRWYSSQHHSYATPDGYLVPVRPETENDCARGCATHAICRLQAIANAWNSATENRANRYADGQMLGWRFCLRNGWPELAVLLDALTEDNNE